MRGRIIECTGCSSRGFISDMGPSYGPIARRAVHRRWVCSTPTLTKHQTTLSGMVLHAFGEKCSSPQINHRIKNGFGVQIRNGGGYGHNHELSENLWPYSATVVAARLNMSLVRVACVGILVVFVPLVRKSCGKRSMLGAALDFHARNGNPVDLGSHDLDLEHERPLRTKYAPWHHEAGRFWGNSWCTARPCCYLTSGRLQIDWMSSNESSRKGVPQCHLQPCHWWQVKSSLIVRLL